MEQESISIEQEVVYALDLCGNFTFLNRAGEQILGYSCEEVRRMNVADVMQTEVANQILGRLARNAAQRIGEVFEIEATAKDGRRLQLEVSMRVVSRRGLPVEIEGIAVLSTSASWARPEMEGTMFTAIRVLTVEYCVTA